MAKEMVQWVKGPEFPSPVPTEKPSGLVHSYDPSTRVAEIGRSLELIGINLMKQKF